MPANKDQDKSNPCLKEQNLVYKCFNDNSFDKEVCQVYIKNYRNCKDFWGMIQSQRRSKGIRPYLPPPEEREKIKTDFISSVKK